MFCCPWQNGSQKCCQNCCFCLRHWGQQLIALFGGVKPFVEIKSFVKILRYLADDLTESEEFYTIAMWGALKFNCLTPSRPAITIIICKTASQNSRQKFFKGLIDFKRILLNKKQLVYDFLIFLEFAKMHSLTGRWRKEGRKENKPRYF